MNVHFKTILRERLRAGLLSGFPSTAPPPVSVSAVLGTRAVWIPNQKKKSSSPVSNRASQKLRGLDIPSFGDHGATARCVSYADKRTLAHTACPPSACLWLRPLLPACRLPHLPLPLALRTSKLRGCSEIS